MRSILCALILLSLVGGPIRGEDKPVVLLTGFGPFSGVAINPSWETVKTFHDTELGGCRIETIQLPVVYDEIEPLLQAAIARYKPKLVISFGVGSQVIQVETLARNGYHPVKPKDVKGNPPPREKINPTGPDTYPTRLPAAEIVAALSKEKIGASTSTDAGGYLCNECFYRIMAAAPPAAAAGFVHVPMYDTKDPAGGKFDAEKLKSAMKIVIETSLKQVAK